MNRRNKILVALCVLLFALLMIKLFKIPELTLWINKFNNGDTYTQSDVMYKVGGEFVIVGVDEDKSAIYLSSEKLFGLEPIHLSTINPIGNIEEAIEKNVLSYVKSIDSNRCHLYQIDKNYSKGYMLIDKNRSLYFVIYENQTEAISYSKLCSSIEVIQIN